ncbi:MAG: 2-phospho-L-lactate transferase [Acidobacteriota bacterium]
MKITALAGGIGASKFLAGLARVMPPEDITIIANTGDDMEMFGLRICPDIDTVTYTLAGLVNQQTGWGIEGDTFECLHSLARLGEDVWFNLGDRDLATHIYRADRLKRGVTLAEVTDDLRRSLGVRSRILPMSDAYTPTRVITDEGDLHLQEYFVRRRCAPVVKAIRYENIERARPAEGVEQAIIEADSVIICPSNPFISIGPILAVPRVRDMLRRAKVAAITPVVAGRALKGPTAEMLRSLGHEVSAVGVARLYKDFANLFVLDEADTELKSSIEQLGLRVAVTNTVMATMEDKENLARRVIEEVKG